MRGGQNKPGPEGKRALQGRPGRGGEDGEAPAARRAHPAVPVAPELVRLPALAAADATGPAPHSSEFFPQPEAARGPPPHQAGPAAEEAAIRGVGVMAVGETAPETVSPPFTKGDFLSTLVTVGRLLETVDDEALDPLKTLTVEQVIILSRAAEKSRIGWEQAVQQQAVIEQSKTQPIDPMDPAFEKIEAEKFSDDPLLPPQREVSSLGVSMMSDEAALYAACKEGRMDVVRRLAARGGRALLMSPANSYGDTCLHGAAKEGQLAVVEFLLERAGKACLLKPNEYGETALHLAAREGHLNVVKLLAAKGGIELLKSRDREGCTALHTAAYKLRLDIIRFLAKRGGKDLLFCVDDRGRSVLFHAVFYEDNDMLKHLESDHVLEVVSLLVDVGGHKLLELKGQVQDMLTGETLPAAYTPLGIAEQQGNSYLVEYLQEASEMLQEEQAGGGAAPQLHAGAQLHVKARDEASKALQGERNGGFFQGSV
eukprot:CAMPEP_0206228112 /NCGR_PEP_ID=MMETSP0047_2-20121206/8995_1 /ASSEMBLY_ACC=CAM_ASM_000192 /TAXON_ID=195065 /ORGANISM="Chroomonas mesostigmatica_cf, Strain CCMP1168" /LENGTH=483 /DNA_ID=CAMNT_0053651333 /DNA_START=98 /DNA_END=1552 /DNA_ORIENTATION=+